MGKCLTNSSGWTWAHAPTGSFCFGHGMHGRWALALWEKYYKFFVNLYSSLKAEGFSKTQ